MDRINEIRARCEAASPGPWELIRVTDDDFFVLSPKRRIAISERGEGDAKFIAHTREDIPYLLSELERYKALEREGRLVELPCKVGATIWVLEPKAPRGVEETRISRMMLKGNNSIRVIADCAHDDWGSAIWDFHISQLGVRFFLSEQAARDALGVE